MNSRKTILICNDDGYYAEGIRHLRAALEPLAEVITVAPIEDCSGMSHKITISGILRLRQFAENVYAVNGSPVDCIHLALHAVMKDRKPDLVVSGINHGPNLGEDTAYSGTVAAAYEAFVHGIPALALSAGREEKGFAFLNAAKVAAELAAKILDGHPQLRSAVWNVNVPPGETKGFRLAKLDRRSFKSSLVQRTDPRGETYYWLGPYHPTFTEAEDTDYVAYRSGYVALTPLKVEMTHAEVLHACLQDVCFP